LAVATKKFRRDCQLDQIEVREAPRGKFLYLFVDEEKMRMAQHRFSEELVVATKNFRRDFLLGEGDFGRVYKG
jgi:hypothetical protein